MNRDSDQNQISGTQSSDNVTGSSEADILNGLSGDDVLDGQTGADIYHGGAGSDRYILNGDGVDTLYFRSNEVEQDILDVSLLLPDSGVNSDNLKQFVKINANGVYVDTAGLGQFSLDNQVARFAANNPPLNNVLTIQTTESSVIQFNWRETANIPLMESSQSTLDSDDSSSHNVIAGTSQMDTLIGTQDDDVLVGQWGDDVLKGGPGADVYIGGAGSDRYILTDTEAVDTLDFKATAHQQDILDISALLPPEAVAEATAANLGQYVKVTKDGVYLDKDGEGNFDPDSLIARFTPESVFSTFQINLQLAPGTTILLDVDRARAGVTFEADESIASNQAVVDKLHKYQLSEEAQGVDEVHDESADTGFIRSTDDEQFRVDLNSHGLKNAFGGQGDEQLDATTVVTDGTQNHNEAGHDVHLYGRAGNDTLLGNDYGAYLDGGAGADRIESGGGRNFLAGGEGEDEFVLSFEASTDGEIKSDLLYDFTSQEGNRDLLDLQHLLPSEATASNIHSYVKVTADGIFVDLQGAGNFTTENQLVRFGEKVDIDNLINLRIPDGSRIQINLDDAISVRHGTDGSDNLVAGDGSDTLYGDAGNDILDGDALTSTASADHLYGGDGNDTLHVDRLDIAEGTVSGGDGFDRAKITADAGETVQLDMHDSGIESARGGDSNDVLDGSGFTDTSGGFNKYTGEYETTEAQRLDLYGRDGDDTLIGGVGRDYLDGGADNDIISGGLGRDFLNGGTGNDVFVLADDNEVDTLWDFKSTADEHDVLDISAFVADGFDSAQLGDYFHVDSSYVYFDSTGQGQFTDNQAIAKLGSNAQIDGQVSVRFNNEQVAYDPVSGQVLSSNSAPTAADSTVTTVEDTTYTLTKEDFNFSDSDTDDVLAQVRIDTLPTAGVLILGGAAISAETVISVADINAGQLKFVPAGDAHGNGYDQLTFSVADSANAWSAEPATLTIDVTAQNDAPIVGAPAATIQGTEDTTLIFTKDELLANTLDVEGDDLFVENVAYNGTDGTFSEAHNLSFGSNSANKIELTDKLESFDAFSVAFEYTSTGSHSGSIDSLLSVATPDGRDNALHIAIGNSDGSMTVFINNTHSVNFNEVDINDGATHNITFTWDSTSGDLKLFDNNQLLATKTLAQGETIAADGWLMLGQEQGSYGDELDSSQSLTNAELGHFSLTYDAVNSADIEAGVRVVDASSNVAVNIEPVAGEIVDSAHNSSVLTAGSVMLGHDRYEFTPDQDFNGTIILDYEVSDGVDSTVAQAHLNLEAVNDGGPEFVFNTWSDDVLVAYSFDSTADASGNSHTLTLSGSATTAGTGYDGRGVAFEMNGADGAGEIAGLQTGGAMSVSSWVKFDSFDQYWSRVFDFGDGQGNNNILLGHVGTTNALGFHIINDPNSGSAKFEIADFFTEGEWVHVTATIANDGTMSVYKNGELAGEMVGIIPVEAVRNNNYIGKSAWGVDGYLDGAIDEFAVYDTALTAEQVQAIYEAESVENQLNDLLIVAENSSDGASAGTVTATDVDNDALTYSLTNDGGGRFTIDSITGEVFVSPGAVLDYETSSAHSITVQVSDGNINNTHDYTVKVTNQNDAATTSQVDLGSSNEDIAIIITEAQLLANASDDDSDLLSINGLSLSDSSHGMLEDNGNGSWTFTPAENFNGEDVLLNFNINDGTVDTAGTAVIDITAVNDAPVVADPAVRLQGTEDIVQVITKDQLLANASDVENDTLSISDVSYSGSDGTLVEVQNLVFGDNSANKIDVSDKLQSMDAFSVAFEYTSTGSHSGSFDSLLSVATPDGRDNALHIAIDNSDGSMTAYINNTHSVNFNEVNINDGATHDITFTWDSTSGDLKLFDNNQLLATKTLAQGETIVADGWLMLGQEQDSYGGGLDSSHSLTNAELGHFTFAYDAVNSADIEAGLTVRNASTDLALNIQSVDGQIVDTANDSALATTGSVSSGAHDHYEFIPGENFNGEVMVDYALTDGTDTTAAQAVLTFRDDVEGSAGDDVLTALASANHLQGFDGSDTLLGSDGNDLLDGGAGNDILTGGDGSDTFIWHVADVGTAETPAEDVITDFHLGQNGDVLDLSDVLTDNSESLEEYLSLNFENGNTTIDVTPAGDGSTTQKITLEGVDLSGYGGGTNDAEIINNLINDGNLQIDP